MTTFHRKEQMIINEVELPFLKQARKIPIHPLMNCHLGKFKTDIN